MRIIPRANFKEEWIKKNLILEKDELAIIFTDSNTPGMVIGDGKTPVTKCRNITPFAFIEVVENEKGVNKVYFHKSPDDYRFVKQTIEEMNKNEESTE